MANEIKRPIRILHVLTAMNRAGAETMIMNLYRSVDHEKIQFDFAVTTTERCDYDDEIEALGGKIIHYPRYTGKNHFVYIKWWNSFFQTHPEYNIIHGHIGSTASIYLLIAKKNGRFTIAHSHSTGGKWNLHDTLYRVYSYSTRFIADYFIGCSTEALVSRYGKKVAANHQKSYILKNGIDIEKYAYSECIRDEVRKELNIDRGTLLVGTVGRFTEAKNTPFIVDILAALKMKEPDFRFIWAGTGELKEQIERYIEQKGLKDHIQLLGVRNDIPRLLQAINVFILPSKFEGLPVIGVEVQAAGVPMLCSDHVSPEVNLSGCIKFLPIDSVNPWVQSIQNEKTFRRVAEAPSDLLNAGYDIRTTSSWLSKFYEDKWSRGNSC